MNRFLEFYIDGAYSSKSQMGGWACVCYEDGEIIDEKTGYEPYTTNNRMEIMGILAALETLNTVETGHTKAVIYTDSAYVSNTFNQQWYLRWLSNGWRTADKKEVKNQELWSRAIALYIKLKKRFDLDIVKVESHASNVGNNYADLLAVKARKMLEE